MAKLDKKVFLFIFTMTLGTFVVVLDNTIMNVSITALVQDLNTTVSGVQTAIALNALMMAAFVLLGGKMGDIIGQKKTFTTGAILYIAGSGLASLSNTLTTFMLGWCLIQGIGAAFMLPNVQSLLRRHTQGAVRTKAYGMLGGVNALGTAVGPILGGFLTAYFSWRWAFRLEVITLIGVLFLSSNIPADVLQKLKPKVDWLGAALQAVAMLTFVTGILMIGTFGFIFAKNELALGPFTLTPFGLSPALVMMGVGALAFMLFIMVESRRAERKQPILLDLKLFANKAFNSSLVVHSIQIAIFVGLLFTVPLFLQVTYGLDAFQTGLIMLPFSVTIVLFIRPGLKLAEKHSPKKVVQLGYIVSILGSLFLMALVQSSEEPKNIIPGLILFGIGQALIASQMANFVMSSVTSKQAPEASGVNATFEQLGNSIGVAVLGTVLTAALTASLVRAIPQSTVLTPDEAATLTQYVESTQIQVVTNDQVFSAVTEANVSDPVSQEIVSLYQVARTNAFQSTMLFVAFFSLVGLISSVTLPKKSAAELVSAES